MAAQSENPCCMSFADQLAAKPDNFEAIQKTIKGLLWYFNAFRVLRIRNAKGANSVKPICARMERHKNKPRAPISEGFAERLFLPTVSRGLVASPVKDVSHEPIDDPWMDEKCDQVITIKIMELLKSGQEQFGEQFSEFADETRETLALCNTEFQEHMALIKEEEKCVDAEIAAEIAAEAGIQSMQPAKSSLSRFA